MPGPTPPSRTYLPPQPGDRGHRMRSEDAPVCDMQLPILALRYRVEHHLMKVADFSSYNITAWRLAANGGGVEYLVRQNTTIGELAKEFGAPKDGTAEVGFHAEMMVAQEVYLRPDVRGGQTAVSQVFTERFPCRECQSLLAHYPQLKGAPYYYYLSYTDKTWQKEHAGGTWSRYLMQQYGV